jgi:hypothetical protein
MKKLVFLAAFLCVSAQAEWQLIHTEPGNSRFFIDLETVTVVDTYKRIWVLNDLGKANDQGVMSFRSVEEYDCPQVKGRVMQIAAFTGEMASGEILARGNGNGNWIQPESGTLDEKIMQKVCAFTK